MAEKLRDNDNFIYQVDPNWKNSSVDYAHVLRDVDGNAVTVVLKMSVTMQEISHKIAFETCQELVEISVAFKYSLNNLRNGRDE